MSLASDVIFKNNFLKVNATQCTSINAHSYKSVCTYKSYITFVIHPPLMMAQIRAKSTWEIINYGRFISQFPLNTIRLIRQVERINKEYVDKKCL